MVPAQELETLLKRRKAWHDTNISKFVEAWKEYVDPGGADVPGPVGVAKRSSVCGLDYALPE